MKQRIIIVILLCFAGQLVIGQNNKIAFEKFASNKDSLMVLAYKSRDTLAYKNQLNELISEYNKLGKTEQKNYESSVMNAYYNFACTYALINEKNKALDYLEKSKYYDYNHLLVDKDLDNIRNVKRFKNFLKYAKERTPIYLKTLKNAKKYNFKDKRELLKFTYQSNNNSNLIFLRKTFKLDSIAGEGSDILKIISLLHWVHNIITHDGNNGNPEIKNAYSLITACKKENKTLNCRGMAIVLNEVYLSMGYKSRFVTCLPKDSTDHDCHVINMVFASSLNKWIWMDPTFNAYVMNEKGELLGLEEVRERLINNKPLILNPDANWNHKITQTKEDYLYNYMAKNLYRLECPVNSEYDFETETSGKVMKYNEIVPLDYNKYKTIQEQNKQIKNEQIINYSNNPTTFWARPEE